MGTDLTELPNLVVNSNHRMGTSEYHRVGTDLTELPNLVVNSFNIIEWVLI